MDNGYDVHRIKTNELGLGGHQISFSLDSIQPPNDDVMVFYEKFFTQDKWEFFCKNAHKWVDVGIGSNTDVRDVKALVQVMYSKEKSTLVTLFVLHPQQEGKKDGVDVILIAQANPFMNFMDVQKYADTTCPVIY